MKLKAFWLVAACTALTSFANAGDAVPEGVRLTCQGHLDKVQLNLVAEGATIDKLSIKSLTAQTSLVDVKAEPDPSFDPSAVQGQITIVNGNIQMEQIEQTAPVVHDNSYDCGWWEGRSWHYRKCGGAYTWNETVSNQKMNFVLKLKHQEMSQTTNVTCELSAKQGLN